MADERIVYKSYLTKTHMSKNQFLSGLIVVFLCLIMAASFAFDVNAYLYATETSANVQNSTLTVGGVSYTLYTISGKDALLVKGGNVIQVQDEISSVLKSKCFASAYPSSADLDEIQTLARKYNSSRDADAGMGPAEYRCLSATGQNIIDCTDVSSCQAACSSAGITQGSCGRLLAGYGYGLANALVDYANARHTMNGNTTAVINAVSDLKSATSIDQLTFDASEKINALYDAVMGLKAAGDSMSTNKIFIHYLSGGYYLCSALNLDNASIASAVTKVSGIKTNSACFGTYAANAKTLLNNTLDRNDYRLNVRQREIYQQEFTTLMGEYNTLTANVTQILTVFSITEINQSMSKIEGYAANYYAYASAANYDAAGQEVSNIKTELDTLNSQISDANAAYAVIGVARDSASASVEKLNILIESTDVSLAAEKSAVISNFNKIEANLTSKVSYSAASALADQYSSIVTQVNAIIAKKQELEAGKVGNVFSDFSSTSALAVLNVISEPLGVREEEKRTWMTILPTMVIIIIDIIIFAIIFLLGFFLLWRKTKDFMKAKVIKTWAILFAFILILIIGMSFALNSLISSAIGPTSYFDFNSHLSASDSATIFVEYSSSESTVAIGDCASKIESALNASGKTVTVVTVVDKVCKDTLYSECLKQVGDVPIIKIGYAKTNSTVFYTFYKIEANVNGDAAYFDECTFANLLK